MAVNKPELWSALWSTTVTTASYASNSTSKHGNTIAPANHMPLTRWLSPIHQLASGTWTLVRRATLLQIQVSLSHVLTKISVTQSLYETVLKSLFLQPVTQLFKLLHNRYLWIVFSLLQTLLRTSFLFENLQEIIFALLNLILMVSLWRIYILGPFLCAVTAPVIFILYHLHTPNLHHHLKLCYLTHRIFGTKDWRTSITLLFVFYLLQTILFVIKTVLQLLARLVKWGNRLNCLSGIPILSQ